MGGSPKDPWQEILQELSDQLLAFPSPKHTLLQLYMHKHKVKLEAEFDDIRESLPGLSDVHRLPFCNAIAQKHISKLPENILSELELEMEHIEADENLFRGVEGETLEDPQSSAQAL